VKGTFDELTVGGTVTVAVIVTGLALDVAVEAAEPHDSFWLLHSSNENPGPESEVHVVNCCSQAAPHASVISSNSCSKTKKESPFLETEGGSPPRERENSKNDSTTVTFWTTAVEIVWAADEALVAEFPLATEEIAFPPLFPFPFFAVVVDLEVVVVSAFPPPFPFPLFAVVVDLEVVVVSAFPLPFPFPLFPVWVFVAFSDVKVEFELPAEETITSGPILTAAAAAAAAAIPFEPSFAATLIVVPLPITVNLVQSS
jgi:hypothetical protein